MKVWSSRPVSAGATEGLSTMALSILSDDRTGLRAMVQITDVPTGESASMEISLTDLEEVIILLQAQANAMRTLRVFDPSFDPTEQLT